MHYSRVICLASILDLIGMDFSKDTDVSLSVKDFISSYPLYPGLELSQFLGGSFQVFLHLSIQHIKISFLLWNRYAGG